MATLYVSWLGAVDKECAGQPIKAETVTTSGTSAASSAVEHAVVVKVQSDTAHYVTIGTGTPTAAATNSVYVAANEVLWLRTATSSRGPLKVAAITA